MAIASSQKTLLHFYSARVFQTHMNITAIANYKLADIIVRVLQEENRRKANALGQGSSLNNFSTTKNLEPVRILISPGVFNLEK